MSAAAIDLDTLQRAVDGLRSQQESVRRERAELQNMQATVEANLSQFRQRVKLNVGGSKFETTLSTLTRYPESMLGAMFSGRHEVTPDEEGHVFIDRDGTHFRVILNYLRTGCLDVPHSDQAANELKRELDYYQLPSDDLLSGAQTLEVVHDNRENGRYDRSAHEKQVEAKRRASLQLRIVSNHESFVHSITTVLGNS